MKEKYIIDYKKKLRDSDVKNSVNWTRIKITLQIKGDYTKKINEMLLKRSIKLFLNQKMEKKITKELEDEIRGAKENLVRIA